jgi:abequosyltransferase
MSTHPTVSVCIPSYGRVEEFTPLLNSLLAQEIMPLEIIVCEDNSPEREKLRNIASIYSPLFAQKFCPLRFEENTVNLGYDGNIRRLISLANGDYVFFIGNDDFVLSNGIKIAQDYVTKHTVLAASRSFARFEKDPSRPVGYSRVFKHDIKLNKDTHGAGWVIRVGGFFGGLIFQRQWAEKLATNQFDGTLFYQIYLLMHAYAEGFIGYMASPTVAARAGNNPLFGNASAEQGSFVPGRYTAIARKKMWQSILEITASVEKKTGVPMAASVKNELAGRMSFHVFEMFAGRDKYEQQELREALRSIGLYNHILPKLLYINNTYLGSLSKWSYFLIRRFIQR